MEMKTNMELSLAQIKLQIAEMMRLVRGQIDKAYEVFLNVDKDLASEIIHMEERVNSLELALDRDCENFLALYSPVAIDLRYIIAVLNVNTQLERIGDHAEGVAQYILRGNVKKPFKKELLASIRFKEMFETASSMVDDAIHSFLKEDTTTARWVFGKDLILNEINYKTPDIISEFTQLKPQKIDIYLYLFSTMKKLERVGDLAKNIAEETIFYVDAKIVKHKDSGEKLQA
jgi:phosphate transport system protein